MGYIISYNINPNAWKQYNSYVLVTNIGYVYTFHIFIILNYSSI